jgi:hypothetical protein
VPICHMHAKLRNPTRSFAYLRSCNLLRFVCWQLPGLDRHCDLETFWSVHVDVISIYVYIYLHTVMSMYTYIYMCVCFQCYPSIYTYIYIYITCCPNACEASIFAGHSRDARLEKLYFRYITWCRETGP